MAPNKKEDSLFNRKLHWMKDNKIKSFSILLLSTVFVLTSFFTVIFISQNVGISYDSYKMNDAVTESDSFMGTLESSRQADYDSPDVSTPQGPSPSPEIEIPGIKIIEANAHIKTDDIQNEEEQIRDTPELYKGYIQDNRLTESLRQIRVSMTVRVPSESFDSFFEDIREQSEIENFSVSDYRIDVKRRETELGTVRQTIKYYDEMIEETRGMYMNNERINLIKTLTDQKMQLVRQENNLTNSLEESMRLSNYSTVRLTLTQSITPKIWPEDVSENFLEKLQLSVKKSVDTATSILGNMILALTTVIGYILLMITIIIPIWITFRLIRRLYIHIYRSDSK